MRRIAKKKVLHVTFNMEIGGTEQVIRQIVRNAENADVVHEILCIDGRIGALGRELASQGTFVTSFQRRSGLDIRLVRFIRSLVRKRDVDVLHCHQYTPFFYGGLAAFGMRLNLIFTEHGRFYPDHHHFKRRLVNPILAWRAQHITTISNATAAAVARYEYIPRAKIVVIYNGIEDLGRNSYSRKELLTELGLPEGHRYIGTISRLEPIKNQAMMIEAFRRVKTRLEGVKLIIIGDGAIRADLEELVESLELGRDVIFTGYLDNPQKFISLFDVFLLSSFSEGASMTLLEAMSFSKPCVVTDVGGNPEIILDGQNGCVVPNNNVSEFARSTIALLEDNATRTAMAKVARSRFLDNFDVSHMSSRYRDLY